MPRYKVQGDILCPGYVWVEAENDAQAVERSLNSENWLDHEIVEMHKPYMLSFQPGEPELEVEGPTYPDWSANPSDNLTE